ncbi:MAG TPA: malto-oligosyltrehalose trehalohydrolase [Verrucomicrobiae bacterium]
MKHQFSVWAPLARRVEVQLGDIRRPMRPESRGWWDAILECGGPRIDYGFILDGEGPYPDPRSPWQPDGVHALSRWVDQTAFRWTDAGFKPAPLGAAVLYELHVGTFTPAGTFDAAIEKLEHLVQLGITHVELMPVNAFAGHHGWGYDGVGLFAVHQPYGGPEALKRFVDACHARRIGVLLDVVYNHLGPSGNYLGKFGPYFSACYQTPWGPALNFGGRQSDEVRQFFCENALMWLRDYHFDGLRLDAVHAILDTSAKHFLEELREEVAKLESQLGRRLVLIAESDLNDPRLLWPSERGGFGLHAQWSDDFHNALHALLTGERMGYYEDFGRLADLAKALTNAYVYDGQFSKYRQRRHGRPHGGLNGHRFVGYIQNHDQIGNRVMGHRLSQLVDVSRVKMAAALVLTGPFVPLLFMGEEWGASTPFLYFADHQEPVLAKAVREGRRKEFAAWGWRPAEIPDPQARETFENSKLNWNELAEPAHSEMHDWYRQLIQLRRRETCLADSEFSQIKARYAETARWLAIERGPVTIVCNFGDSEQNIPIKRAKHQVLLTSTKTLPPVGGSVVLPGWAIAILKQV